MPIEKHLTGSVSNEDAACLKLFPCGLDVSLIDLEALCNPRRLAES